MSIIENLPPWDGIPRLSAWLDSAKLTGRQRQRVRRLLSELQAVESTE
jgi:hypothetical protein